MASSSSRRLTAEQITELRECFKLFDKDNSGFISAKELMTICKELELNVDKHDVESILIHMDKNGDGLINFDEFSAVMADQFNKSPSRDELIEAFRYFDKDNNGYITEDELLKVMTRFKTGLIQKDVSDMIRAIDRDQDNRINLKEFLSLFKR